MALITKKLSGFDKLEPTEIDNTTKIVALSGQSPNNKNILLSDLIEDTLTSTNEYAALSAKQGKALKSLIDNMEVAPSKNVFNTDLHVIETSSFNNGQLWTDNYKFLITPGSYGVTFTDPPIVGLDEFNFNLRVDYVSHDDSGEDGDQDILQTLTTKDGVSYTRRLYHVFHQADMSATDFKMVGGADLSSFVSTETLTKYTKIDNTTLIEL